MLAALAVAVFLAFAAAFGIGGLVWMRQRQRQDARQALSPEKSDEERTPPALLREERPATSAAWLASLRAADVREKMHLWLQGADLGWTPGKFAGLTVALAVFGLVFGLLMQRALPSLPILLPVLAAAWIPYGRVGRARARRARLIEEQFPDALDFLSRAMRAGHAFSVSLEMLAEETPQPLGGEFQKLFQQQNLGAPLETALQGLADRCGLLDVQFFVSAVLMQKETGGNLTEILSRLSATIRERLRLKGHVRAASAHGRVTGMVLTAMPLLLTIGLMVINPGYLTGMVNDPHGRYLIGGAIGGLFLGYVSIRSITNIRV
jgi:tight adherence protein B